MNAVASVPGSFKYTPAAGVKLGVGAQTLNVTFTPVDTVNYNIVSRDVTVYVQKITSLVTWGTSTAQPGATLSSTQLNAVASVPGSFKYTPAAGSVKYTDYGVNNLHVDFTPNDTLHYNSVSNTPKKGLGTSK